MVIDRRPDPLDLVPLKPLETLVMTMLASGDRHGYGIRQEILTHTGGRLAVEAGNLYRHIRRLESVGAIEESGRRRAKDGDDERRIYYRLTGFGRRLLATEMLRMRALVRLAEAHRIITPEPA